MKEYLIKILSSYFSCSILTCSIQLDLGLSRHFIVELANFAPNFVQVGEQLGIKFAIEVGPKLGGCETA
jgi:hypothetical protein